MQKATVNFSNSYAQGGDALTPAQFGLGVIIDLDPITMNAGGVYAEWNGNTTSPTLIAMATGSANAANFTQVANATNLSTIQVDVDVYGY